MIRATALNLSNCFSSHQLLQLFYGYQFKLFLKRFRGSKYILRMARICFGFVLLTNDQGLLPNLKTQIEAVDSIVLF